MKSSTRFAISALAAAHAILPAQKPPAYKPTLPPHLSPYNGVPVEGLPPAGLSKSDTKIVQVGIKLTDPPLVVAVGPGAKQSGFKMSAAQQQSYLAMLKAKQDALMTQVAALGGTELGRVSKAHNALLVLIDSKQITALKNLGGVSAVRPIIDRQLSDAEPTYPYVGDTALQNAGVTGQGVRIAMLDTGIDYTHYNLGGSGNIADYNAATAVASGQPPAGLFPTAKVVGGYDFTGEVWPNGPLAPDPNPIDLNGHGSHTSDIAGGHSLDGKHSGAAPGAQLYAVKICSSVGPGCSTVASLQGLDFALDPSNSGTLNDAVDIISLSVGGAYGQREDDESEAFTDIVNFGVFSVVAAGNSGNSPYILSQPGATPEVLTMGATTQVTGFVVPLVVNTPAAIRGTYPDTATLDFAPINSPVTGTVIYVGRGCPANGSTPPDKYLNTGVTGHIALIDRGTCDVSSKIDRAAKAGAAGVLIGLIAPGDAIPFSLAGGNKFVPALVITESLSNALKANINVHPSVSLSLADQISTAGAIANYSSRGPNYSYNMLKPDLTAPGTIVAADPGTGNGESAESGTSFATPLAAGSAALLLSKNHAFTPLDLKALLMGSSNPNVSYSPATQPGVLAPVTLAGAGELRVDRSAASTTAAWDASDPLAVSLSFGTWRLNVPQTFKKKVVVRNYSASARTYQIASVYRNPPNETGVTLNFPASLTVAANSSADFVLDLGVVPASLPVWTLDGGPDGGNGALMDTVEYGGFLTFTSGDENIHLPWHILPHRADKLTPITSSLSLGGNSAVLDIANAPSSLDGQVDVFSLIGTETQFPPSALATPGDDLAVINLQAFGIRTVCLEVDVNNNCNVVGVQFAVNTYGQRSHPSVPAQFGVFIDVNGDGVDDLDVFNADMGIFSTGSFSGQDGVFVEDLTNSSITGPYFFIDADLDSANAIMTVPVSALVTSTGLQLASNTQSIYSVGAFDNYFSGKLTDEIVGMVYELDSPEVFTDTPDFIVPANTEVGINVFSNGNPFSPAQTGLLLMYRDAKAGQEASQIVVAP